jgi:hypothetical protein
MAKMLTVAATTAEPNLVRSPFNLFAQGDIGWRFDGFFIIWVRFDFHLVFAFLE